ncbi:MAG TPA: hypothetical protein VFH95_03000 [Candidatus Kapabacteria bacterium]|nr:hypothetical protein [Candidatus Kapabacteria bacterium]
MILDNNIYTFKERVQWSFNKLLVRRFHYNEPPMMDTVATDLDSIKWNYGMWFKFEDDLSRLTLDFDVIIRFPDRDTKILSDFIKLNVVTTIGIIGLRPFKEDTNMLREFVGHCASMNWWNILSAVTERCKNTILDGKIKSPLAMPSSFLPLSLENSNSKPDANEGYKYTEEDFQRALDVFDRLSNEVGDARPPITQFQWAFEVVKDRLRDTQAPDITTEVNVLIEQKKKILKIDFHIDVGHFDENSAKNDLYVPVTIETTNGTEPQEIIDYWFEDKTGEHIYIIPPAYKFSKKLEPGETFEIHTSYFQYDKSLVRAAIQLSGDDEPIIWSLFKEAGYYRDSFPQLQREKKKRR